MSTADEETSAPSASSTSLSPAASLPADVKRDTITDSIEPSTLPSSTQVATTIAHDHQTETVANESDNSSSSLLDVSSKNLRNELPCGSLPDECSIPCKSVGEYSDEAVVESSFPVISSTAKPESGTIKSSAKEVDAVEAPSATSIPCLKNTVLSKCISGDHPSVVSTSPTKQSNKNQNNGKENNEAELAKPSNVRNELVTSSTPVQKHVQPSSKIQSLQPSIRDIVIGLELPPTTLSRHFSMDASIASSLDFRSVGSNVVNIKGSSASRRVSMFPDGTKPGDIVLAPHPNDVLFPLAGMAQWPGNELFLANIESSRQEFLSCDKRSEQARIALEIIQEVIFGIDRPKQPASRFLTKKISPNPVPGTTCPWIVMDETSVLVQLGKAFRGELDGEKRRKIDKSKKKKMKFEKQQKSRKNWKVNSFEYKERTFVPVDSAGVNENSDLEEEESGTEDEEDDPLVAIKTLYHIPSYGYQAAAHPIIQIPKPHVPEYSRAPQQNRSGDSNEVLGDAAFETAASSKRQDGAAKRLAASPEISGLKQNRPYKRRNILPNAAASSGAEVSTISNKVSTSPVTNSGSTKEAKLTSKVAAFVNEGELVLPKGVTVRPSGKWQAQTYFAGQSRYVGVYPTSRLASHAYRVVQSQLKMHRRFMHQSGREYGECSKDEVSAVFYAARREADKSVRDLEAIIAAGSYKPLTTEQQLLSALESRTARKKVKLES